MSLNGYIGGLLVQIATLQRELAKARQENQELKEILATPTLRWTNPLPKLPAPENPEVERLIHSSNQPDWLRY